MYAESTAMKSVTIPKNVCNDPMHSISKRIKATISAEGESTTTRMLL
jgi:hypothetical protein